MKPTNQEIADVLTRIADLLEAQDVDRYRVSAYRRAADTIGDLDIIPIILLPRPCD